MDRGPHVADPCSRILRFAWLATLTSLRFNLLLSAPQEVWLNNLGIRDKKSIEVTFDLHIIKAVKDLKIQRGKFRGQEILIDDRYVSFNNIDCLR